MSNSLVVKINPAEITTLQQDGKSIVFSPKAEEAIIRLLEIQKEVDGAIEWLKSEIERQALEFNPNFSAIKGERLKVNYLASGAKYKDNGELKRHKSKFWKKKIAYSIDSKAVDDYKSKHYRLPLGIVETNRSKTIRLTVSEAKDE